MNNRESFEEEDKVQELHTPYPMLQRYYIQHTWINGKARKQQIANKLSKTL